MIDGYEILKQNPEVEDLLLCAKRAYNKSACSYKDGAQPLVLCHFSDIHGDATEIERAVALKRALGDGVHDFICTGDMVQGRMGDGMEYWLNTPGAESILLAIGNHDTLASSEGFDFSVRATQKEQFDTFFAQGIGSWNVVCEKNKTYYYKDYPECTIRLIVLNDMLENEDEREQAQWFKAALFGARKKNFSVVCANHSPKSVLGSIKTGFNSLDRKDGENGLLADEYYIAVDEFSAAGGSFVCWLTGHLHMDLMGTPASFPKQLTVSIDSLSRWQSDYFTDLPRTDGTRFQDMFNLTVVDTTSSLLHIIRIGANRDRYLRSRKFITLNYKTREVICAE